MTLATIVNPAQLTLEVLFILAVAGAFIYLALDHFNKDGGQE